VILTHGTSGLAPELAKTLVEQGVEPADVVMVHNPTSPGESPPEPPPGVALHRMERNEGYAAGMNAGMRHQLSRGVEYVLILTHELRFRPGALRELLQAAGASPDFGVLGPTLWWRGRDRALSYGGRRRPRGGLEHIQARAPGQVGVAQTDWIDGAAMLFRAEVLERVGLMEERFFIYVEDAEICLRAQQAGWRVGVVLDVLADASPGGDTRPGAWAYLSVRNGLEYSRRALGTRGVMWELARRGRESVRLARSYAGARGDEARRARCRLELRAKAAGTVDFFRGRWGPPPPDLAGIGDIAGTGGGKPPAEGA
jgi:N-acetylglucosaminyl-diphospho-decaprenol L-rhamnosyltransferase